MNWWQKHLQIEKSKYLMVNTMYLQEQFKIGFEFVNMQSVEQVVAGRSFLPSIGCRWLFVILLTSTY